MDGSFLWIISGVSGVSDVSDISLLSLLVGLCLGQNITGEELWFLKKSTTVLYLTGHDSCVVHGVHT